MNAGVWADVVLISAQLVAGLNLVLLALLTPRW